MLFEKSMQFMKKWRKWSCTRTCDAYSNSSAAFLGHILRIKSSPWETHAWCPRISPARQNHNIFFHISVLIHSTHAQQSAVTALGKAWQTEQDQHASTCLINSFSLARFYVAWQILHANSDEHANLHFHDFSRVGSWSCIYYRYRIVYQNI